eukprot:TRINITY_DN10633_c0_g1_i7.p1 TRINITY_DN10633_c0_g1~~TRINITY_DN10633_c0_g1_i7.p1  ORF type:complete len:282 (-),score=38.54 TRINITY_DN10633_c0_g1_i7:77-895(-)
MGADGIVLAVVIQIHGLNSHSDDFGFKVLRRKLAHMCCAVYCYDHMGHGKSEGLRSYIEDYEDLIHDAHTFACSIVEQNRGLPFFIMGSSLGGAIAMNLCARWQNQTLRPPPLETFRGCVLMCPAIMNTVAPHPFVVACMRCCCLPCCPTWAPSCLPTTQDTGAEPDIAALLDADPLRFKGGVRLQTGNQLLKLCEVTQAIIPEINFRFVVVHGDQDKVVSLKGSELLFEQSRTDFFQKKLRVIEGASHMLLSGQKRTQVYDIITDHIRTYR